MRGLGKGFFGAQGFDGIASNYPPSINGGNLIVDPNDFSGPQWTVRGITPVASSGLSTVTLGGLGVKDILQYVGGGGLTPATAEQFEIAIRRGSATGVIDVVQVTTGENDGWYKIDVGALPATATRVRKGMPGVTVLHDFRAGANGYSGVQICAIAADVTCDIGYVQLY